MMEVGESPSQSLDGIPVHDDVSQILQIHPDVLSEVLEELGVLSPSNRLKPTTLFVSQPIPVSVRELLSHTSIMSQPIPVSVRELLSHASIMSQPIPVSVRELLSHASIMSQKTTSRRWSTSNKTRTQKVQRSTG